MRISENFPAPICTKIAAPAHVRTCVHAGTLKVWKIIIVIFKNSAHSFLH